MNTYRTLHEPFFFGVPQVLKYCVNCDNQRSPKCSFLSCYDCCVNDTCRKHFISQ
jgi:hypothetical protein